MDPANLHPRSHEDKFLHISYDRRWDHLKPIIIELYTGNDGVGRKSMTMHQVANFMRDHYTFNASVSQYSSRFRQWGIRKRILTTEKVEMTSALGRRQRHGLSTSLVTLSQGEDGELQKPVDTKQLKRHLKDQIRHHQVDAIAPGVLSSWNLPYAAHVSSLSKEPGQPSPFGSNSATPNYININSPDTVTPGRQTTGLSPPMQLVRQKALQDRATLFLEGRHKELLVSCGKDDRRLLVDYLHDFHLQSIVMAKYWGRGPRNWSWGSVSALTMGTLDIASPSTPASITGASASTTLPQSNNFDPPTELCRWAIHIKNKVYESIRDQDLVVDAQEGFDIQDPSSWSQWSSAELGSRSFSESIQEAIKNSTFNPTPPEDLPMSTHIIAKSLQKSPSQVLTDAWKFAIMAGNHELFDNLFSEGDERLPDGFDEIYPFHLSAAYLDGGNTCCLMIQELNGYLGSMFALDHNIDGRGHTILDAFMVTILRSHTDVHPTHVCTSFSDTNRYPGEEKDICGRWDIDSPAVRRLFQAGYSRIPTAWKHPFCHTAAQAVCHGVIAIFGSPSGPSVNDPSGLFVRRCDHCGLELKLGPLHTLVVVAFYLAHQGMPGETMFGALAILICLLRLGADDSVRVNMSVQNILGTADQNRCHHVPLKARDLMEAVPSELTDKWNRRAQTGWFCILDAFRLAEIGSIQKQGGDLEPFLGSPFENHPTEMDWTLDQQDGDDTHDDNYLPPPCNLNLHNGHDEGFMDLPCGNPELGLLWASIQVELLTYRRINSGTPWISSNFSMSALNAWLEGKTSEFRTPLVENRMMKDHTPCGWFCDNSLHSTSHKWVCPIAEDICRTYFMNMDVYNRTSFISQADLIESWGECN